jgi:hypothetical protein
VPLPPAMMTIASFITTGYRDQGSGNRRRKRVEEGVAFES